MDPNSVSEVFTCNTRNNAYDASNVRVKFHGEGEMLSCQNNQVVLLEKYFTLLQFLNVNYYN